MTDTTQATPNTPESVESQAENKVAYETYQKVLAERKRDQERVRELNAKLEEIEINNKRIEEEILKKKEDYKTLLDNKTKEQ